MLNEIKSRWLPIWDYVFKLGELYEGFKDVSYILPDGQECWFQSWEDEDLKFDEMDEWFLHALEDGKKLFQLVEEQGKEIQRLKELLGEGTSI